MEIFGGEPMEIFVDPVYCAFGDIQGAASSNESFDMNNINSLFNIIYSIYLFL